MTAVHQYVRTTSVWLNPVLLIVYTPYQASGAKVRVPGTSEKGTSSFIKYYEYCIRNVSFVRSHSTAAQPTALQERVKTYVANGSTQLSFCRERLCTWYGSSKPPDSWVG